MTQPRRSHTTPLGSIASTDLTELGAGKEFWLDNPNILCALTSSSSSSSSRSLAISNKFLILILNWRNDDYDDEPFGRRVEIRPLLSPIEAEFISAVEWIGIGDGDGDGEVRVLGVGTSSGYFLVYSLDGDLIHKQMVYPGRILKLRVRGMKRDLVQAISSEEVSVVLPGIIARFDGSDIQSMLGRWFQERRTDEYLDQKQTRGSDDFGTSYQRLPYQLWNVSKYGTSVDSAITGIMPPPLMEFESSQRYYCAVTVGNDAVISAFRLSEDRSRSLVGAILSKVVPATFSTITSVSRLIWRSDQTTTKKPEPRPQAFARATPLTCIKDPARKGEKLTLTPSGTLAAITDSLGRILLLDTRALVVVRLWKGYRDASCLFMEMLVRKESEASTSAYHGHEKGDYCLCLVIHAPRKGIVEVWQMRTGPRLLAIRCSKGSKILQPPYRLGSSAESSSAHVPLEVFLLDGDSGQLSVINRSLR